MSKAFGADHYPITHKSKYHIVLQKCIPSLDVKHSASKIRWKVKPSSTGSRKRWYCSPALLICIEIACRQTCVLPFLDLFNWSALSLTTVSYFYYIFKRSKCSFTLRTEKPLPDTIRCFPSPFKRKEIASLASCHHATESMPVTEGKAPNEWLSSENRDSPRLMPSRLLLLRH